MDQKACLKRARALAITLSAIPLALFARPPSPGCPAVSATCSWLPYALDKTKDQSANKALDLSLRAWHRRPEVPRVWERQFHVVVKGPFHSHESTGQSSRHRGPAVHHITKRVTPGDRSSHIPLCSLRSASPLLGAGGVCSLSKASTKSGAA